MDVGPLFAALGVALGLGLLVGLQRQWSGSRIAGVRTFPLVTLAGAISGLLARAMGDAGVAGGVWIVAAGVVAIGALAVAANVLAGRGGAGGGAGGRDPGMTTEAALVAMFMLGAYATVGPAAVVAAIGVAVAVLLQAKSRLHGLVERIGEADMRAIVLFAAITFIVLPVLPDRVVLTREMGELAVWNPRHIWLMVVLVSGISLAGYVVHKAVGARVGTLVSGALGGVISSTATTAAFARRAREAQAAGRPMDGRALVVIVLASGVVFARLLLAVWIVAPVLMPRAGPPLAMMLGVSGACALAAWLAARRELAGDGLDPGNPAEVRSALVFAGLYALVLLGVAAARRALGERGLYVVAGLSGLTDMDAITLSVSRLAGAGDLAADTAWRAIVLASMSNLVFKLGLCAWLGTRRLALGMGAAVVVQLLAAGAILRWW